MNPEQSCKICSAIPKILGKKYLMPLLGHSYPRIERESLLPLLTTHNLVLVGGLATRGFTQNDIDVLGEHDDVVAFAEKIRELGIKNPVHHCGTHTHHSHLSCAINGIKLAFTGRGF